MTASPTLHPPCFAIIFLQASRIAPPPARCIAPSTPPPPKREVFAALTIASTLIFVMSPLVTSIFCCGPISQLTSSVCVSRNKEAETSNKTQTQQNRFSKTKLNKNWKKPFFCYFLKIGVAHLSAGAERLPMCLLHNSNINKNRILSYARTKRFYATIILRTKLGQLGSGGQFLPAG